MTQAEQLSHNYAMVIALEDAVLLALDSVDPMEKFIRLGAVLKIARAERAAESMLQ